MTGNDLELVVPKKKVAQIIGTTDVFDSHSGISGPTLRRASAFPDLHEWWTQHTHVRCPVAQILI
jgi:hypothetical protein